MKLRLDLYRGDQRYGWLEARVDRMEPSDQFSFSLHNDRPPAHAAWNFRVDFVLSDRALPGFNQANTQLSINGTYFDRLPIAWYDAEPTDFTTGVARFVDVFSDLGPAAGVWVLAVRRAE